MKQIKIYTHKCSVGELLIGTFENKICLLDYKYRKMRSAIDKRICDGLDAEYIYEIDPLHSICIEQLDEYLKGERKKFDLPLLMVGTDFQKKVWEMLLSINYGETKSYLELAKSIDNEKIVRAVANANGANAISITIPCHRIIGSNGELTGYAGGINSKRLLLDIERKNSINYNRLF